MVLNYKLIEILSQKKVFLTPMHLDEFFYQQSFLSKKCKLDEYFYTTQQS